MRRRQHKELLERIERIELYCQRSMTMVEALSVRIAELSEQIKAADSTGEAWIQKSLDSIMSFQAGKKKEGGE